MFGVNSKGPESRAEVKEELLTNHGYDENEWLLLFACGDETIESVGVEFAASSWSCRLVFARALRFHIKVHI